LDGETALSVTDSALSELARFEKLRRRCNQHYRALGSIGMAHNYAVRLCEAWDALDEVIKSALHVAAVVAYTRPFTAAITKTGKLQYPVRDLKREPGFDTGLHDHLLVLRDQLIAHSDYTLLRSTMFFQQIGDEGNVLPLAIGMNVKRLIGVENRELAQKYEKHFSLCAKRIARTFEAEFVQFARLVRDHPEYFDQTKTLPTEKIELSQSPNLQLMRGPSGSAGDVEEPEFAPQFAGYKYQKLTYQRSLVKSGLYPVRIDGKLVRYFFATSGPNIDDGTSEHLPIEIDVSKFVPLPAVAITLVVTIAPPSAAALVYSLKTDHPVRFNGPTDTKRVPIDGSKIYLQLVQGATDYQVAVAGYELDIG
jgi:hypothetical protein